MIIGSATIYLGDEFPEFKGQKAYIHAVLHDGLLLDPDSDEVPEYIRFDSTLASIGGVTVNDSVAVALENPDGRSKCVDVRAIDLECFSHLRR